MPNYAEDHGNKMMPFLSDVATENHIFILLPTPLPYLQYPSTGPRVPLLLISSSQQIFMCMGLFFLFMFLVSLFIFIFP